MPPVILFVGTGKVGKTTFIEKLIPELVGRGYCVATIKHTVHKTTFDQPEKDTARHVKAGSAATAIASPSEFVMLMPGGGGMSIDEMVRHLGDNFDIVIAEGFKHENGPKIEVHRREKGEALAGTLEGVVAVITDEPLKLNLKQFSLEDIKGVADFIEADYIKPHKERFTLFVNEQRVPLAEYPGKMTANAVTALIGTLRKFGEGEIKSIDISIKR